MLPPLIRATKNFVPARVQQCYRSVVYHKRSMTFEATAMVRLFVCIRTEKHIYHNLYAHNQGRNPRPGNYTAIGSDMKDAFRFSQTCDVQLEGTYRGIMMTAPALSAVITHRHDFIKGPESGVAVTFSARNPPMPTATC